jgi:hypothetical protein
MTTLIMKYVIVLQPYFERVWGWNSHSRNGDLESSETFEILEFDCRGQNTSYWGVLYIIKKLSKCRCWKWARMGHLDMYSTSYGKTKRRKLNWQFDSRPLKVGNRPDPTPMHANGVRYTVGKLSRRATSLLQTSPQLEV